MKEKDYKRWVRHRRIRARMRGNQMCPRLVIHRSLKYHEASLVDDEAKKVILSVTDKYAKIPGKKSQRAREVGKMIAKKALEKGITTCIFDRAGYRYHGRVKAIAEGAREGGLRL